MSSSKKDTKRRELGSSSRFPGGSVPAPGRSTPTGESSEGRVAGLPAGSAADTVTAEVVKDWSVFSRPDTEQEKAARRRCQYLLSVALGEMPASSISESESRGDSLPDGQKEMPIIGEKRGSSRGAGSRAVSRPPGKRGPRAVEAVEVDSASDEYSDSTVYDDSDDDYDDYVREEFGKRYFDVILPSDLMTEVDIFMSGLSTRSPKQIVSRSFKRLRRAIDAERLMQSGSLREEIQLGNELAKQSIRCLAKRLRKAEDREASNLSRYEGKVKALRNRAEIIQKERDSFCKEVETLKKELQDCRAQGREERGKSGHQLQASSVGGGSSHASEDVPLARDPSLGEVPGMIPEDTATVDTSVRGGKVNGTERIAPSVEANVPQAENNPDCPPPSGLEKEESWVPVTGKGGKRKKKRKSGTNSDSGLPASASDVVTDNASGAGTLREGLSFAMAARGTRDAAVSGRDPRVCPGSVAPAKSTARTGTRKRSSAVVVIRCSEGGPSYTEVMGEARSKVPLKELGIVDIRLRRAQTGGLLIEIQGENAGTKADSLAERLSSIFKEREDVRVIRPIRRLEFRLVDLDVSVTADEIKEAVAARGRVPLSDVRVGPLRPRGGGLNSVWLQCPEPCAEVIRKDGGLQVGWSRGRLIPLDRRRLQCYRCLAVGHTRVNCRSAVDRSSNCFKCGKEGHKAIGCRASPHCPVCAARSLPAGHRAGADGCAPYNGLVRATVAAAATVPESGSVPPLEDAMVVDG